MLSPVQVDLDVDDMVRRTEVGVVRSLDRRVQLVSPGEGHERIYVVWKPTTVGNWSKVIDRRAAARYLTPTDLERRVWMFLVEETNLVMEGTKYEARYGDRVAPDVVDHLFGIRPGNVLHALVRPVLESVVVTPAEITRLEKEAFSLWASGNNGVVNNPHPLLAEVLTAVVLNDRLGVAYYQDIPSMPQRKLEYIRKVFEYESKARDIYQKNVEAQGRARRRYAGR